MELVKLNISDKKEIKNFFREVFTKEPWNDDWSDEEQLECYIVDLIGNKNSLTLAYFDGDKLAALAMGHIRHWYSATEYYIDELCVKTQLQGQGIGGKFINAVEKYLKEHGIGAIFLLTEKNVPAYEFYKKHGFEEHKNNVAFGKWIY
ncbi:MAG: GNAT family N-acetyltransferase [Lachnospiraceae bacterium]|nr:GNAT family N-acetyltransferase [Lachnospiraceae bacterium]MCI8772266.1 GNAT family N-acetyltransferase [Lachnospiraceae bacterium]